MLYSPEEAPVVATDKEAEKCYQGNIVRNRVLGGKGHMRNEVGKRKGELRGDAIGPSSSDRTDNGAQSEKESGETGSEQDLKESVSGETSPRLKPKYSWPSNPSPLTKMPRWRQTKRQWTDKVVASPYRILKSPAQLAELGKDDPELPRAGLAQQTPVHMVQYDSEGWTRYFDDDDDDEDEDVVQHANGAATFKNETAISGISDSHHSPISANHDDELTRRLPEISEDSSTRVIQRTRKPIGGEASDCIGGCHFLNEITTEISEEFMQSQSRQWKKEIEGLRKVRKGVQKGLREMKHSASKMNHSKGGETMSPMSIRKKLKRVEKLVRKRIDRLSKKLFTRVSWWRELHQRDIVEERDYVLLDDDDDNEEGDNSDEEKDEADENKNESGTSVDASSTPSSEQSDSSKLEVPIPPPTPCVDADDTNESCSYWASTGECEKNPPYMLAACPKSCRACEKKRAGEENLKKQEGNNKDESKNGRTPKTSCTDAADTADGCAHWASTGECEKNPGYMLSACPTSCKACEVQRAKEVGEEQDRVARSSAGSTERTSSVTSATNSTTASTDSLTAIPTTAFPENIIRSSLHSLLHLLASASPDNPKNLPSPAQVLDNRLRGLIGIKSIECNSMMLEWAYKPIVKFLKDNAHNNPRSALKTTLMSYFNGRQNATDALEDGWWLEEIWPRSG